MLCGLTTNFLQNNAYQLILPRFPLVQYYSTDFILPEVNLPVATAATPYTDLRFAGDKPQFGQMTFNFMIDENLANYEEVFNWLNSIGFAESQIDYTNYTNKDPVQPLGEQDVKVVVLSSKGNPIKSITFFDAIPVALSGWPFTTQDQETHYVKASLTMAYTRFEFDK